MKDCRFGDVQGLDVVVPWKVSATFAYPAPVRLLVAEQTGPGTFIASGVSLTLENARMLARSLDAVVREIEQARAADDGLPF